MAGVRAIKLAALCWALFIALSGVLPCASAQMVKPSYLWSLKFYDAETSTLGNLVPATVLYSETEYLVGITVR